MYLHNGRGEQGGEVIADTAAHTPADGASFWAAGVVMADAVLSAVTMPGFDNSDNLLGLTLFAGTVLYGRVDSITLASGVIQMFNYVDPNRIRK